MKMKKLKNVWLFLSFILMVAGMASCSTDDPTGVDVSRDDIIGTWKVTAMTGQIRKVSLVVMILSTWDRRSR